MANPGARTTAAMILGIVGGLLGLLVASDLAVYLGTGLTEGVLAIAIVSIVGGAIMRTRPALGTSLMAASVLATAMLYAVFSVFPSVVTGVPTALSAAGALVGLAGLLTSRVRPAGR